MVVIASFSAYADSRSLVAVNNSSEDIIRPVTDRGIVDVRNLGNHFLAVADKENMEKLSYLGLDWQLLDSSIEGKTYYTVGLATELQ